MTSLGDRMKNNYEKIFMHNLPARIPIIIRLDGKAFHTFTRGFNKPFDDRLINWMNETTKFLCKNLMGVQMAYVQSDEISLLLHPYKKLNSQAWFNGEIQKIVSVSAGMASSKFMKLYMTESLLKLSDGIPKEAYPSFDSRVFVIPEAEVCNYFIGRQQDWTRNSIQMVTRSMYSEKECYKKNQSAMQDMCMQKGVNWNDYKTYLKRGRTCIKKNNCWSIDNGIPIFTQDRNYIEKFLKCEEN
jgi:tRNA(His) 5'-end guanylyltransferase